MPSLHQGHGTQRAVFKDADGGLDTRTGAGLAGALDAASLVVVGAKGRMADQNPQDQHALTTQWGAKAPLTGLLSYPSCRGQA